MPVIVSSVGMNPIRAVRLLIADTDPARQILADLDVEDFLTLQGADPADTATPLRLVRLAAADALDAIATSEALVSKAIRTQDLATDGPKLAKELRERAAGLRALVAEADAAADGGFFDVVEFPSGSY